MVRLSDPDLAKALDKWCRKAVRKYCERRAIMDGYGFVINPKGSLKYQPWHIDYTTDAATIWVPMRPLTDKNATEYLTLPPNTPWEVLEQLASYVDEVDMGALACRVDYLIMNQIVAKPMSMFYMGRGTIHRGIPNTGEDDRVVFYISVHFIKDYENNYPYDADSLHDYEPSVTTFEG
jgi:hypothetical protein